MYFIPQRTAASVPIQGGQAQPESSPSGLVPLQDAALLAAARGGSNEAAGEIFDRHATALLQVACAVLREGDQAEAVVADVIVQICSESTERTLPASLRRELAQLSYLHSVRRLPTIADGNGTATDHDGAVVAMTNLREVARQQRVAIALVMVGDHTYLDVARLLRLPPARVLALLHSSLRDLKPPGKSEHAGRDQVPLVRRRHSTWASNGHR